MYKVIIARHTHYPQIIEIERTANSFLDEDFGVYTHLKSSWLYKENFDDKVNNDKLVLCVAINNDGKVPDKVYGYAAYHYNKKTHTVDVIKLEGDKNAQLDLIKHIEAKKNDINSATLELFQETLFASHDRRLAQHLLLKELGYKAVRVKRNYFEDGDAYIFLLDKGKK